MDKKTGLTASPAGAIIGELNDYAKTFTANGILSLISLSHLRGAVGTTFSGIVPAHCANSSSGYNRSRVAQTYASFAFV